MSSKNIHSISFFKLKGGITSTRRVKRSSRSRNGSSRSFTFLQGAVGFGATGTEEEVFAFDETEEEEVDVQF